MQGQLAGVSCRLLTPANSTLFSDTLHASQALPALADSELAPAIGLIFKLASETSFSSAEAVKTVRQRVKQRRPDTLTGSLEAIRWAVNHHLDVAQEMLVDIDSECKSAKPLSEVGFTRICCFI